VYRVSSPQAQVGPENAAHPGFRKTKTVDSQEVIAPSFKVEEEMHIGPPDARIVADPSQPFHKTKNPMVPNPGFGRQGTLPIDFQPSSKGPHARPWTETHMHQGHMLANHPSTTAHLAEAARVASAAAQVTVPAHPYADYANGALLPDRAARPKQGVQRLLPGMPTRQRKK
jgi:hypothetical protein